MANRVQYDIRGYTVSATPTQVYSRAVKHWSIAAHPDNANNVLIRTQNSVGLDYFPLAPGMSLSHGDFEKQGNDDYLDVTKLYFEGTSPDTVHIIVMFEDR